MLKLTLGLEDSIEAMANAHYDSQADAKASASASAEAKSGAANCKFELPSTILLCDRGALDVKAHCNEESASSVANVFYCCLHSEWKLVLQSSKADEKALSECVVLHAAIAKLLGACSRYSGVFVLQSTASLSDGAFTTDNNPARSQGLSWAKQLDAR